MEQEQSRISPSLPDLQHIFGLLMEWTGDPGWWPLDHRAGSPGFDEQGYHPNHLPADPGAQDIWCVFLGAVLTQRSTWVNARRAVVALVTGPAEHPGSLAVIDDAHLGLLIRPSGFYNQKARRLKLLERELMALGFFDPSRPCPSRKTLLDLPGLGPETADVLANFARMEPGFVSDAYTSRIFGRLQGRADSDQPSYGDCRSAVLSSWNLQLQDDLPGHTLQEAMNLAQNNTSLHELRTMHALLVELGKRHCKTVPLCGTCPLQGSCLRAAS